MIPALESSTEFNLGAEKGYRAIGGFSSGADGSMRLAAVRNDLFIAMVGHSGLPSLDDFGIFANNVISEMGSIDQTLGNFDYDYEVEPQILSLFFTHVTLGMSAVMSPSGDPVGDFLLDESGEVRTEIMDHWTQNYNVANMIDNPDFANDPVEIYFEWAQNDLFSDVFSETFEQQLQDKGLEPGTDQDYHFATYPTGGHALDAERVRDALRWLDTKWDLLTSMDSPKSKNAFESLVYPVPAGIGEMLTLQIDVPYHLDSEIRVISPDGQVVESLKFVLQKGENKIQLSLENLPTGLYYYQLITKEGMSGGNFLIEAFRH